MKTQTKPVSIFAMIRSIITENQQATLIDLREKTSAIQWQAGDLVNDLFMQVMANNMQASIMDVCCFVSDEIYSLFAPSTLRIYAAVAKFYPVHERTEDYSFWMYRYATRFEQQWDKVFIWADGFSDAYARQPYEREVRGYFEPATMLMQELQSPCQEQDKPQLPIEIQAIEDAAVTQGYKSSLKVIIAGLLSFIPGALPELHDPEAKRLLSQIGVLVKQLLEQYL